MRYHCSDSAMNGIVRSLPVLKPFIALDECANFRKHVYALQYTIGEALKQLNDLEQENDSDLFEKNHSG